MEKLVADRRGQGTTDSVRRKFRSARRSTCVMDGRTNLRMGRIRWHSSAHCGVLHGNVLRIDGAGIRENARIANSFRDLPLPWIAGADVGSLAESLLLNPALATARAIYAGGVERLTYTQIADIVSRATGRSCSLRGIDATGIAQVTRGIFYQGLWRSERTHRGSSRGAVGSTTREPDPDCSGHQAKNPRRGRGLLAEKDDRRRSARIGVPSKTPRVK
jgi:hypothetical protein